MGLTHMKFLTLVAVLCAAAVDASSLPALPEATLADPVPEANEWFGADVTLSRDGMWAVVGAPKHAVGGFSDSGNARVFSRNGSAWSLDATLEPVGADTPRAFGDAVAISDNGSFVLVGCEGGDVSGRVSAGSAFVFFRNETRAMYEFEGRLVAPDPQDQDRFGVSVALSGDGYVAVVGAYQDNVDGIMHRGSAFVFERSLAGEWSAVGQALPPCDGGAEGDRFGAAVSISGDGQRIAVGADLRDADGATDSGGVYVFSSANSTWLCEATLLSLNPSTAGQFGRGVALDYDGNTAIVGGPLDDTTGGAYIFARDATSSTWTASASLEVASLVSGDRFGYSASISSNGSIAVVGAFAPDNPGRGGAAYVFSQVNGTWGLVATLRTDDRTATDSFGEDVFIDGAGDRVIVGALLANDARGMSRVYARVTDSCGRAGYSPTNYCVACGVGRYGSGTTPCLSCPAGTISLEEAANSSLACVCAAGTYSDSDTCVPCPAGRVCPAGTRSPTGTSEVAGTPCSLRQYCPEGTGSTIPAERLCPAGFRCATPMRAEPCIPGELCPEGSAVALQCPAGYYCPSAASVAVECPERFYCPSGSGDPVPCSPCEGNCVVQVPCSSTADAQLVQNNRSLEEELFFQILLSALGLLAALAAGYLINMWSRAGHSSAKCVRSALSLGGVSNFNFGRGYEFLRFVEAVVENASPTGAADERLVADHLVAVLRARGDFLEGRCGRGSFWLLCNRRPKRSFLRSTKLVNAVSCSVVARLRGSDPEEPASSVELSDLSRRNRSVTSSTVNQ